MDISGWQSNTVNWAAVKTSGMRFNWTKATEGTYYVNPWIAIQVCDSRNIGVPVGAYHYAVPSKDTNITGSYSADTEAAFFWSVAGGMVKTDGGYLVPMLDWEDPAATNGHDGYTGYFTTAHMSAWVNEWCKDVSNDAAAIGITLRPVVYTGTWYSDPARGYPGLDSTVTNWPNWMSNYDKRPAQSGHPPTTPWPRWDIWQYADTNVSGGDSDVYNGDIAGFWETFAVGGTTPRFSSPVLTNAKPSRRQTSRLLHQPGHNPRNADNRPRATSPAH